MRTRRPRLLLVSAVGITATVDASEAAEDLLARFSIDYGVKYGQGGFGVTYQALDTATRPPTLCAVMVIDVSQMSLAKIKREVSIARKLKPANVEATHVAARRRPCSLRCTNGAIRSAFRRAMLGGLVTR